MKDTQKQRGRERERSRRHAGSPTWDSILGLQNQALGWRQRYTAEPPGLPELLLLKSFLRMVLVNIKNGHRSVHVFFSCTVFCIFNIFNLYSIWNLFLWDKILASFLQIADMSSTLWMIHLFLLIWNVTSIKLQSLNIYLGVWHFLICSIHLSVFSAVSQRKIWRSLRYILITGRYSIKFFFQVFILVPVC